MYYKQLVSILLILIFIHSSNAARLASGRDHSCLLLLSNDLKCWGRNDFGQLGVSSNDNRGDEPLELGDNISTIDFGEGLKVEQFALGRLHTCVLLNNGGMKCFGDNSFGQLGYGDTLQRGSSALVAVESLPYVDVGEGVNIVKLSLGSTFTCVLLDNAQVKCFGDGADGVLGSGSEENIGDELFEMGTNLSFVDFGTNSSVRDISCGFRHTCVILESGKLKCFGKGDDGELLQGGTNNIGFGPGQMGDNLTAIDLGISVPVKQLVTGLEHSCVLLEDDRVKCWGESLYGALGNGTTDSFGISPETTGSGLPFLDFGQGLIPEKLFLNLLSHHWCVLFTNGNLKCLGRNENGQLGLNDKQNRGDNESSADVPIVKLPSEIEIEEVATGFQHTCVLTTDERVFCFGGNSFGQLGKGDTIERGGSPGDMEELAPIDLGSITSTPSTSPTTALAPTPTNNAGLPSDTLAIIAICATAGLIFALLFLRSRIQSRAEEDEPKIRYLHSLESSVEQRL